MTEEIWASFVDNMDQQGVPIALSFLHFRKAKKALEAALADVPEPLGTIINYDPKSPPSAEFPFRLTEAEEASKAIALRQARVGDVERTCVHDLIGAVDRAVRTLAAPTVEPLSLEDNRLVESVERTTYGGGDNALIQQMARIIRKHTKKPEPRKRTAEELEQAIIDYYGDSYDVPEVVEELIALAKQAKP